MLRIARWRRPAALLVSLFIPFAGALQSYAALACETHASATTGRDHHHHGLAQSRPGSHDHAGDQAPSCNCQSLCQSAVVLPSPGAGARVIEPEQRRIQASAGADTARPANRETHLLPFSTAPPFVA